jgi:tRNA(fMet)-specific endonuclease VapC
LIRFLLDTNSVIDLFRSASSPVARRLRRYAPSQIGLSSLVLHELFYGAFKSRQREANLSRVEALALPILDFDALDAREAGEIRARLAREGRPIGPLDSLIAGQARARQLTLVTHNTREFERVPGLRLADWSLARSR